MKPITQILTSVVFTFLLSLGAYIIIDQGLNKFYIHKEERLNEIFKNDTNHDILFIGSSRTHTTINPKIVDSICNSNSYNAGVEGGNLLEFKMTWDAYLENHPAPRVLVLTLDINSFDLSRKFFNYTQYFSYLNNTQIKLLG